LDKMVTMYDSLSSANAGEWSAKMPESVVGLSGSCVLIPCTFSYPANGKTYTEFTGIWYKGNEESTVYHTDTSKIIDSFKGRTSLIGDLRKNYCSLKISSLSSSDAGPFMFRIEINDLNKYTYKKKEEIVSITVKGKGPLLTSGKPVTATCAVSHSCPSDLPRVSWSHDGSHSSPSQPQNHGQWKLTSYSLTFTPSREDHNKRLSCSAEFKGKTVTGYKTLKVKSYISFSRLLKFQNHNVIFFLKSTPISLNYKHYSPALTHESDLVNCYCKTLHTNPYISQCLHHVVIHKALAFNIVHSSQHSLSSISTQLPKQKL
uniref:Si:dkey-238d18.5 n=1 Tax=Sinocyclocheilus rhinocerous TaxID=307959 RepID=A0A673LML1_9TELE